MNKINTIENQIEYLKKNPVMDSDIILKGINPNYNTYVIIDIISAIGKLRIITVNVKNIWEILILKDNKFYEFDMGDYSCVDLYGCLCEMKNTLDNIFIEEHGYVSRYGKEKIDYIDAKYRKHRPEITARIGRYFPDCINKNKKLHISERFFG